MVILLLLAFVPGSLSDEVLLAKPGGVDRVDVMSEELVTRRFVEFHGNVSAVDFHAERNELYFIAGNTIFVYPLNATSTEPSKPRPIITSQHPLTDLAVDWVQDVIYWSCNEAGGVYKAKVDGSGQTTVLNGVLGLSSIAFDPYARALFYTTLNKFLNVFYEPDNFTIEDFLKNTTIRDIFKIAADVEQKALYVIEKDLPGDTLYLTRVDYRRTEIRRLHSGSELANPSWSLDVSNGSVVWSDYDRSTDTYNVYFGVIPEAAIDIRIASLPFISTSISQSKQFVWDVKLWSTKVQKQDSDLCVLKTCSHGCSNTPPRAACLCPPGLVLGADGRNCISPPPTEHNRTSTTQPPPSDKSGARLLVSSPTTLSAVMVVVVTILCSSSAFIG